LLLKALEGDYNLIAEYSMEMIDLFDRESFNYLYASPANYRLLGFTPEELMGQSGLGLVHPEDMEYVQGLMTEGLKKGSVTGEFRERKKDGSYVWVDVQGYLIKRVEQPDYIMVITRDINERKLAQIALELSENRYRLISENAQDLICLVDANSFNFIYTSPSYSLLGWDEGELLGQSCLNLIHQDYRPLALINLKELLINDWGSYRYQGIKKDGSFIWFESVAKLINTCTGSEFVIISRDISESKRAEEALRSSEERLREITDNMLDGIALLNRDGVINYVSPSCQNLLGYSPQAVLAKTNLELVHPEDRKQFLYTVNRAIRKQSPVRLEFRCRHAVGYYIWLEAVGNVLIDDNNSTIANLFKDIDKGINCFNALTEKFSGDPFIWQQKALFQLSFEDFEGAKDSISQALNMNPNSHIFQNTQGTIYLKESLIQEDPVKAAYLRDQGKIILVQTARKYTSPFHYHSLANKLISWYKTYPSERNQKLIEEIQDILSEATRLYPSDSLIMGEVGRFQEIIPNVESAKNYFQKAIDLNPRNMSARFLLSKILINQNDISKALEICSEGVILKDDEVLLNRLLLETMHKSGTKKDIILDQYNRYLRIVKNDFFIKLCHGAYLYLLEDDSCSNIFADLRINPFISNREKYRFEPHVKKHINITDFAENAFVKTKTPRGYLLQTERFSSRTLIYCNDNNIIQPVDDGTRIRCHISFCYMGPVVDKAELI
jgi:PAS domain S-box-containing protein